MSTRNEGIGAISNWHIDIGRYIKNEFAVHVFVGVGFFQV